MPTIVPESISRSNRNVGVQYPSVSVLHSGSSQSLNKCLLHRRSVLSGPDNQPIEDSREIDVREIRRCPDIERNTEHGLRNSENNFARRENHLRSKQMRQVRVVDRPPFALFLE